jgi:K+-transporting ATPase c subunit
LAFELDSWECVLYVCNCEVVVSKPMRNEAAGRVVLRGVDASVSKVIGRKWTVRAFLHSVHDAHLDKGGAELDCSHDLHCCQLITALRIREIE